MTDSELCPLSETSFLYKGQLVDLVAMKFESKNCGAGRIHIVGNVLCVLQCIASELFAGDTDQDLEFIEKELEKYRKQLSVPARIPRG